jgi:hypothetical protein
MIDMGWHFRRSCPNGRVIGITDRPTRLTEDVDEIVFESDGTAGLLKAIGGNVGTDTAA